MNRVIFTKQFRYIQGQMPPSLQQMIDGGAGPEGLHPQAVKISGWLRHHTDSAKGEDILAEFLISGGRSEREARMEARRLVGKWKDARTSGYSRPREIRQNIDKIREIVSSSSATMLDLKARTPCPVDADDKHAADDIVDLLFPNGEIIWISHDGKGGSAFPRKEIPGRLEGLQFICPNPMKVAGEYQWDKEKECTAFSPRCKANVKYRRWLVLEWDTKPVQKDGKTPSFWAPLIAEWKASGITTSDAQVRLIANMFGREFGMGMVVHSGNESLHTGQAKAGAFAYEVGKGWSLRLRGGQRHSWWAVAGKDETVVEHFIAYAQLTGVDAPVARDVSHYVRMPHGKRPGGRRQPVLYLDPAVLGGNGK